MHYNYLCLISYLTLDIVAIAERVQEEERRGVGSEGDESALM